MNLNEVREFGNIEILAKQLVEGFITGLHKSPYHGFSVEFAEHRLYNTGESTRHIDWKVYARTDRLFTKRYEEETNLRCMIILDNSSSMYYPRENKGKITFSIMVSAALAYLLQKQRDAVGLCTFSEQIEQITQVRSTSTHLNSLFAQFQKLLEDAPRQRKSSVAEVLHQVADQIPRRSLVIIFSDMFENQQESNQIFSSLQHLKHNKHEVLLFHTTDQKTELNFDFEERPYEFIDMEKGEKLRLNPSEVKEKYQEEMKKYYHELKIKCGQSKIDFIEADINDGYEKVLRTYLTKRARMK
jgi:uncharacterized protein (DUF58 family)